MSEADANRDLLAAAERPDPLEITQTMTFSERRADKHFFRFVHYEFARL